ncbi:MAG: cache domain-containing protein [Pseudomonadota bacterium]
MDMKKRVLLGCLLGSLWISASSWAAEPGKQDAIDMVNKAMAYHKANGKDKTLAVLNKKDSEFVKGELYVFAYDLAGTVIAHPLNARLVGKNMLEIPDQEGKFYRKDVQKIALSQGTGWVDYLYKNPETNKIERKSAYVQKVEDMILVCGIYVGAW